MRLIRSLVFASFIAIAAVAGAQTSVRLDALVLSNGLVRVPVPAATTSSTQVALNALGLIRDADGAARATVWAIDNTDSVARTIELQSRTTEFNLGVTLAARERVIVRVPEATGRAEHRLALVGSASPWIASKRSDFMDATLLVRTGAANVLPRWHSSTAVQLLRGNAATFWWPIVEDANNDVVTLEWNTASPFARPAKLTNSFLLASQNASPVSFPARVRISDTSATSANADLVINARDTSCALMPITLPEVVLAGLTPGENVQQMPRDLGTGNWSWLSWTGAADAPTLAASLRMPGNSERYVDPDDATDVTVSELDWVQGAPGNMNAAEVRAAMDALIGRNIRLPVWKARRGQGNRFDVHVSKFATVALTAYQLTGQGSLSFTYLGSVDCQNHAPVANGALISTERDTPIEFTLSASDADGDVLTFRSLNLPTHGVLSGTAPFLTYTPNPGYVGADSLTFVANDGESDSEPARIDITVTPKVINNHAPDARSATVDAVEDEVIDIVLGATDSDGDVLTFVVDQVADHGVISGTAPNLHYTPAPDFNGEDRIRFHANDGALDSDIATITLNVQPRNDAPTADSQSVHVDEDGALDIFLTGQDIDDDTLTSTIDSQPEHGTLGGNGTNVRYTPDANFFGNDTITFHVNDGAVDSAVATVSITVVPVNDAPTATGQSLSVDEDQSLSITLTGEDIEGDDLSFVIDAQPEHGTLSGVAPNVVYTPAAHFSGNDAIRFHVNDGTTDSATMTISIAVNGVNAAPVANAQSLSVDEDQVTPIVLSASDADGDPLDFIVDTSPAHGTLSGIGANLSYTPAANFFGSDTITFHANDGAADSAVVAVSITVLPVNDAPTATGQSLSVDEDQSLSITLAGEDIESNALNYVIDTQPDHGTLSGVAPNVVYTPAAHYSGNDAIRFHVHDGTIDSTIVTIQIVIRPVNDPPQITSTPVLHANGEQPYVYDVAATDADGDALTYLLANAPEGATIIADTGLIAWTPSRVQVGAFEFTVAVRDADAEAIQTFSVTVAARSNLPPRITSLPITDASRGLPYQYLVKASDPDGDIVAINLDEGPSGLVLDTTSGMIEWTPGDHQVGTHVVAVRAEDGRGGEDVQRFSITVIATNRAPRITSVPVVTGTLGQAYRYAVTATDPDGEVLRYELIASPAGMQLDAVTGAIAWTPNDAQLAASDVTVIVRDPHGASDTQEFRVIINADLAGHSHVGREFWFAHGQNGTLSCCMDSRPLEDPDRSHWVFIAAREGASGFVEIAGLGFRQDFTIAEGGIAEIELPRRVMNVSSMQVKALAAHVSSDRPVTVVSMNRLLMSSDAAVIYPVEVLGTNYVVADYPPSGHKTGEFGDNTNPNPVTFQLGDGGQVQVVATVDNTRVTFLPRTGQPVYGPSAGAQQDPWTITLSRGQTYMLNNPGSSYPGYSGMRVASTAPVAVFGGSQCAFVPVAVAYCDHLFEQLLPERNLGQNFLATQLATRQVGNVYKVVAVDDATQVFANGALIAVLQAGKTTSRRLDGPVSLRTSKPAVVLALAVGEGADHGLRPVPTTEFATQTDRLADPFALFLPPRETYLSDYLFATPKLGLYAASYVALMVPESAVDSLRLDGATLPPTQWQPIANTGYVSANVQIRSGRHRVTGSAPFGLFVYGWASYESYGYTGGLLIGDQDRIARLEVTPLQQQRTIGDDACFALIARDEQGHRVPFARYSVQAREENALHESGYFDGTGAGRFCYSRALASTDRLVFQSGIAQVEAVVNWQLPSDGVNRPPVFVSLPETRLATETYNYIPLAVDPNGDAVTYSVVTGPEDASLSASAQLTWTPAVPENRQAIVRRFKLRATDTAGLYTEQVFEVQVFFAPKLIIGRYTGAVVPAHQGYGPGFGFGYEVIGGDDDLLVSSLITAPSGATIADQARSGSVGAPANSPALSQVAALNLNARDGSVTDWANHLVWNLASGGFNLPAFGRISDSNGDGRYDTSDRLVVVGIHQAGVGNYLRARFVDTGTELGWTALENVSTNVAPAIADLDSNGIPEIVAERTTNNGPRLAAFRNDGTPLWMSSSAFGASGYALGATSIEIADLDGDGRVEIIAAGQVYDASGTLRWSFGSPGNSRSLTTSYPLITDLDGDGRLEVAYAGEVRNHDGSLRFRIGSTAANTWAQWSAIDLDGDGRKELIAGISESGKVYRLEIRTAGGELVGSSTELTMAAGVPVVMDLDRDGELDIYLPNDCGVFNRYAVLKTRVCTGSEGYSALYEQLVDLNGDAAYESLLPAGFGLLVIDRQTDRQLRRTSANLTGGTVASYGSVTLLDLEQDGRPEIYVAGSTSALFRLDNGQYIAPTPDRTSMRANDARSATTFSAMPTQVPADLRFDLRIGDLLSKKGNFTTFAPTVIVVNRGQRSMTQPITLSLYAGARANTGTRLAELQIPPLRSNEQRTITFPTLDRDQLQGWIYAYADAQESTADLRLDNNVVAAHLFELVTSEGGLREDRYAFLMHWLAKPIMPTLSGAFPTQIPAGHRVEVQLLAAPSDGDGSTLFRVLNAPAGVQLDPKTGLLSWTPGTNQAGMRSVEVQASSSANVDVYLRLSTEVLASSNRAPQITSVPPVKAVVGRAYQYDVQATDPDGDAPRYRLISGPSGMTIDLLSGVIDWMPAEAHLGTQSFVVEAFDGENASARQSVSVLVQTTATANDAPRFTSTPLFLARQGLPYRYDAEATDADGDALTYSMPLPAPGMSIAATTGLVSWTSAPAATGSFPVRIRVTDARGAWAEQNWTLRLLLADQAFAVTVAPAEVFTRIGEPVDFQASAEYAITDVQWSANVDGQTLSVAMDGRGRFVPTTAGNHSIVVTGRDSVAQASATMIVHVADPNDADPPVVTLHSPSDQATITKPSDVVGTVFDASLAHWILVLKDGQGDAPQRLIARGSNNFTQAAFARFDPTLLHNGQYILVLQATDTEGRVGFDSIAVTVDGDMKLGHFSLSFVDAGVPLSGIPVRITRTYDTRQAHESLDFGHGWSVDYQNVRVRENQRLGFSWQLVFEQTGALGQWCVYPSGHPKVSVTLPDGEVLKFKARFNPECTPNNAVVSGTIQLTEETTTGAKLEIVDVGLVRAVSINDSFNLVNPDEPERPVDPSQYRLTTADGLVYELDQAFGIRKITDEDGHTITYSRSGVRHDSGVGVNFIRDAEDRITSIVLPDGNTIDYAYDAAGDLITHKDQMRNATKFAYLANIRYPHYLETITDPLGNRAVKTEYFDDGRLKAIIDATGKRQEFVHNVTGQVEQVKNRRGHTTTYVYDDNGWVLSETNALGEQITRSYDANGNELTVTDALDRTTTKTHDPRGNVLTESNALGEKTTRSYGLRNQLKQEFDAENRLVVENFYRRQRFTNDESTYVMRSIDALGANTSFLYDLCAADPLACANSGNLTAVVDAAGQASNFKYDYRGNLIAEVDALGRRTERSYDAMGRVLTETVSRQLAPGIERLTTTHVYDDKGQLLETTTPDGTRSVRVWRSDGLLAAEQIYARSVHSITNYSYDTQGRLTRTEYPDNSFEMVGYDEEGNEINRRDRMGRTTKMLYDAANRLVETIHPDAGANDNNDANNPRTKQDYDAAGQLIASWDELNRPTEFVYDDAGRQLEVIDALGQTNRSVYDRSGRRIASIDALDRATQYVHDAAGRVVETILPDAEVDDGNDSNNARIRYDYDAVGRKIAETDPSNRTTRFVYSKLGQLIEVIQPGALSTKYAYDEQGRKTEQTDALGRSTRWSYDQMGRLSTRTLPLGQLERFDYDLFGHLAAKTDFNGKLTSYTNDKLGRRTRTDYPDGAWLEVTYNNADQPLTLNLIGQIETRSYDNRGRLLTVAYADGQNIAYQYDQVGNRTKLTTATRVVDYGFDALNRLVTVTEQPAAALAQTLPKITRYEYDDVGNRQSIEHPNGTRVDYTYNRRNQLTNMLHKKAASVLLALGYLLNPDGSRASIIEQTQAVDAQQQPVFDTNGAAVLEEQRRTDYTYDAVKRLVNEVVDARTDANDRSTAWTYDAVGNRQTQSQQASVGAVINRDQRTYTYDANDRLLTETKSITASGNTNTTTTTHRYDLNGNLLETIQPNALERYRWNAENRLAQHEKTTNGQTAITQYAYTADGLRNRITANANTANAITTRQLIDPNQAYAQVIEETIQLGAATPQLKTVYTHGDDLIAQQALRNSDGTAATSSTSYLHYDGLGTTRFLTNASGDVTDRYAYQAFGDIDEAASSFALGSAAATDYLFTGEQFDPNLGFYYLRARYMDPSNGRFASQDTYAGNSSDPVTLHKYLYANANPAMYTDPSGNFSLIDLSAAQSIMTRLVLASVRDYAFDRFGSNLMTSVIGSLGSGGESASASGHPGGAGLITALAVMCRTSQKRCLLKGIPTFISGRDVLASTLHAGMAMFGNGNTSDQTPRALPFLLSAQSERIDVSPRHGKPGCAGFVGSEAFVCDEYPYASVRQGGNLNYEKGLVSLQWVPKSEGSKQGNLLKNFYRKAEMTRSGPGSWFLNVALPTYDSAFIERSGKWKRL